MSQSRAETLASIREQKNVFVRVRRLLDQARFKTHHLPVRRTVEQLDRRNKRRHRLARIRWAGSLSYFSIGQGEPIVSSARKPHHIHGIPDGYGGGTGRHEGHTRAICHEEAPRHLPGHRATDMRATHEVLVCRAAEQSGNGLHRCGERILQSGLFNFNVFEAGHEDLRAEPPAIRA